MAEEDDDEKKKKEGYKDAPEDKCASCGAVKKERKSYPLDMIR